ncbi:MAG: class I SAM-dependent methyltransferase [Thermomicrobiales bacterium]
MADTFLPVSDRRHETSQAVFQQGWRIYRVLVDENYLFHREAYAALRQILLSEIDRPFRFLDVACGDASASVAALQGTAITDYHGIDLSAAALELARLSLAALDCPATLEHADFAEVLRDWSAPVDVVWIGLSLHHFQTAEKLEVLRAIRAILPEDGHLLIYEDTSPDGEEREAWLQRWDDQRPLWTAYTAEEWDAITGHVHDADYPETASGWVSLAREAGFAAAREVFVAPSDLLRLYWMPASECD